jgi:hypothetical protein
MLTSGDNETGYDSGFDTDKETTMTTQTTQTFTHKGSEVAVLVRGSLEHVSQFDALTPSGAGLASGSAAYAKTDKRHQTARWRDLYAALASRNVAALLLASRRLPSVRVTLDASERLNPNYGLTVSLGNWRLFCAPVVESEVTGSHRIS